MAHKLWEKNFEVNKEIERFTVGRDRELDLYLAKYDVLGSMAHITMLESIGGCSFPSRIDAHPETGRHGQKDSFRTLTQ